ncbi:MULTISPECIES: amidohydrolase [Cryobacterium]|uniref:Amidohydrolase n=1 Tax=Cryobacterium breve TaxID=1259258 RepID=A0ABY2IWJ2_9MICO|nr:MULTISPECIES: amidohydrolase [Cryobacterium]TFC93238.1 amidohydrolase [Cryobacterium sp. TmT3-12]TFC96381.1 amidohydrolase [Cryobacterium breve]
MSDPDSNLDAIYRNLHRNPELSFQEHRTAALVETELRGLGYDVLTGIGGTGVVGILRNGAGPTVMVRADMDALPVQERTGLDYASDTRGTDQEGRELPVMHACGHDMHVTCLIGAARRLASETDSWNGTLEVLFQPAEELGTGATAMVNDGLFDRIPRPEIVLGQHVSPLPAGVVALQPGPAFAAADGIRIVLYGQGGHGSRPETTIDPIVMAAGTVLRLHTIVSRETAANATLVLTIGSLHAGTKNNIIPDSAEILISLRSFDPSVREAAITSIRRIVRGESMTAGAPREATIDVYESFPSVTNDLDAARRTSSVFKDYFGEQNVIEPGAVTGSEDVGILASAAGARCCFWLLGGSNPALFATARSVTDIIETVARQPSNHAPNYAPVIQPTLDTGVEALVIAAREWLGPEINPLPSSSISRDQKDVNRILVVETEAVPLGEDSRRAGP